MYLIGGLRRIAPALCNGFTLMCKSSRLVQSKIASTDPQDGQDGADILNAVMAPPGDIRLGILDNTVRRRFSADANRFDYF
jgi:hypothetical protein